MYLVLAFILMLAFAAPALAFGWGDVKEFFSEQLLGALALIGGAIATNLLAKAHKLNAARYEKVSQTLIETGQFLTATGEMIKDPAVTKEEIGNVIKEGADVVNIYVKTPGKYQVNNENIPAPPEKH